MESMPIIINATSLADTGGLCDPVLAKEEIKFECEELEDTMQSMKGQNVVNTGLEINIEELFSFSSNMIPLNSVPVATSPVKSLISTPLADNTTCTVTSNDNLSTTTANPSFCTFLDPLSEQFISKSGNTFISQTSSFSKNSHLQDETIVLQRLKNETDLSNVVENSGLATQQLSGNQLTSTVVSSVQNNKFLAQPMNVRPKRRHAGIQVNSNSPKRSDFQKQVMEAEEELNKLRRKLQFKEAQLKIARSISKQLKCKIDAISAVRSKKQYNLKLVLDAKNYMSEDATYLFEWQLRAAVAKNKHTNKWSNEDIKVASELFTKNQDAYEYMHKIMSAPGMRTLFTHDMGYLDEQMGLTPETLERDSTLKKLDIYEKSLESEIDGLADMDVEYLLDKPEFLNSYIGAPASELDLDRELQEVQKYCPRDLKSISVTSSNSCMIDLTNLDFQKPKSKNGETRVHEVMVYMSVPPNRRKKGS